jgi:hypothetical protein
VRDAIVGRDPAHFDGHVPGLGTIVNFRKQMTVNIDHG